METTGGRGRGACNPMSLCEGERSGDSERVGGAGGGLESIREDPRTSPFLPKQVISRA